MDTIFPSGIMKFDLSKSNEYDGIEDLYSLLKVPEGSTFEFIDIIPNRLNEEKVFVRYQQYYYGIKVDGGGYTISYYKGTGGGNPCDKVAYMLTPFIASDIDITVNSSGETNIKPSYLDTILESEVAVKSELLLTQNLLNECQYHLVWKAEYIKNVGKISWVDVNTGTILKTINSRVLKNAPTEDYGNQNMDDSTVGTITSLKTSDASVITYDMKKQISVYDESTSHFTTDLIPTSNVTTDWSIEEAHENVYQAHWIATNLVAAYAALEIEFSNLHIGANCENDDDVPNAITIFGSKLDDGYILIGETEEGSTLATPDILGHEMGHIYLFDFLDTGEAGNSSLHEGIADMFGVYMESVWDGENTFDWISGNKFGDVARDLENPLFNCFTDVELEGEGHLRSIP